MSGEVLLRFPEHTSDEDVAVTVIVVLAIRRRAIEERERASIDDEWRFSQHPGFQSDWRHSLN